jgi:hypothetical protein
MTPLRAHKLQYPRRGQYMNMRSRMVVDFANCSHGKRKTLVCQKSVFENLGRGTS